MATSGTQNTVFFATFLVTKKELKLIHFGGLFSDILLKHVYVRKLLERFCRQRNQVCVPAAE
jgi:hypothetical protein